MGLSRKDFDDVRIVEVAGSNPVTSTSQHNPCSAGYVISGDRSFARSLHHICTTRI